MLRTVARATGIIAPKPYTDAVENYQNNPEKEWAVGVKAGADETPPHHDAANRHHHRRYARVTDVTPVNDERVRVEIEGDDAVKGRIVNRELMHAYTGEKKLHAMRSYLLPVRKIKVWYRDELPVLPMQMRLELGADFDPREQNGGTTFYR